MESSYLVSAAASRPSAAAPKSYLHSFISSLDAFPKVDSSYLKQTWLGGITSIIAYFFMCTLLFSEIIHYLSPVDVYTYTVDKTVTARIELDFEISVATACQKLVVAMMDVGGERVILNKYITAEPIDFREPAESTSWGSRMTSSPHQVVEGCHLTGKLPMNKVSGQLIVVPLMEVTMGAIGHIITGADPEINFSHVIKKFSFGQKYPGGQNPLESANQPALKAHQKFTYVLSVIPTRHGANSDAVIDTYQYSVTGYRSEHDYNGAEVAGLFFKYSLEALAVDITKDERPLSQFFVHVIGIIGGIYTCSGMLHHLLCFIYSAIFKRKPTTGIIPAYHTVPSAKHRNSAADYAFVTFIPDRTNVVSNDSRAGSGFGH